MVSESGTLEQVTNYYPFGAPFCEPTVTGVNTNTTLQRYKYNGKELDLMHGLKWYDYSARMYDPVLLTWNSTDPLSEKYYSLSPYNYCGNNPIRFVDPDGCDWYQDNDGTYQYDPNINKDSKLKKGQSYLGESFIRNGAWYRDDGSILYSNETAAYNRMWNQADNYYRNTDSRGREVGGFILKNGKVLVLPDYANDNKTTKIDYYGYKIRKDGIVVTHGKERFNVVGQIHTHQKGSGDPQPSFYLGDDGYGDLGLSAYHSSLPIFTIGHDNKIHGIRGYIGRNNIPVGFIVNMNSRDSSRYNLLKGRTSIFSIIQCERSPAFIKEISNITGLSPQVITNMRKRLLNKIFGKAEGGRKNFDDRISKIR